MRWEYSHICWIGKIFRVFKNSYHSERDEKMIMKVQWVRIWKEVPMAYYKAVFQNLCWKNEDNHYKPQSTVNVDGNQAEFVILSPS
jgi:hypothetical protein